MLLSHPDASCLPRCGVVISDLIIQLLPYQTYCITSIFVPFAPFVILLASGVAEFSKPVAISNTLIDIPVPPVIIHAARSTLYSNSLLVAAAMPPRKRKRQSAAATTQSTEEASGRGAAGDDHDVGPTQQANDGVAMDAAASPPTSDATEARPDAAAVEQSRRQHEVGDSEAAQTAEQHTEGQQPQDGEHDAADGENNGEDEDEHEGSEHNNDADEDDGDEPQQEVEAEQAVEETGGRTRPMRAVRQKAEEEAAAKKRRRKNRKRRRDGTYMGSDEEDEDEAAEPKQRRRRSNAAKRDDDDEDGDREAQKAVQWVQCELCNKWRKAPASVDTSRLPDQWHCSLNTWDAAHASCEAAEEVQQDEETIWPGLPRHFLSSREREDFYFSITRPPFDSAHAPTYPTVQGQPIDLYTLYAHVMLHRPYQTTLEYWAPLAKQLELKPTEKCWKLLRRAYRRHVKAKVLSERDIDAADDKEDEAEGPVLIGASESEAKKKRVYWTEEEDAHLRQAIEQYGTGRWTYIAANVKELGRHSSQEIRNRWRGYTRNRKVKLRVVSDEKLKEMEMEESEVGQTSARSADGTGSQVAGKRPYPADVMEMNEHMRYSAAGWKRRSAVVAGEEEERIVASSDDKEKVKEELPPASAETAEKPTEASEVDKVKTAENEEKPVQQFYHKHRHISVRLSPTVTLPLPVLRRYLCDVVHMQQDSVLRLLKDMWDESDEDERRRLLSEAVHAQLLADSKRSSLISEMDQYCTQTLRKDRRVRWNNQLAAYQQSLQVVAGTAAAAEPVVDGEATAGETVAPTPSPALDSASASATGAVAPLQLATPVRVRKQYKLPAAAFASPVTAATPVAEFTQAGSTFQTPVPGAPSTPTVAAPTVSVRPRTYTLPSVSSLPSAPPAAAAPAVDSSPAIINPLFPMGVALEVSPVPTPDLRSPAALAARIQRPPPLPPNLSSPSSSAASVSGLTSPLTSASNRKANQQRGPYFTSRKRVALSSARDAMLALIRGGTIIPAAGYTQPIDDRAEWTEYDRAICDAVAPGNVEDFTPAGVPLSAMLRLVDDKVLEDQKRRSERRQHGQSSARVREAGSDEQPSGTDAHDGDEDESGSQMSLPTSNVGEMSGVKEEQGMDTTE